jgi:hypothetical protein
MSVTANPGVRLGAAELLDAVPLRNTHAVQESATDREMVITVPLQRRWYMGPPVSWVLPFSTLRRVGLDRYGMEVWRECDGRRCAEEIIERFARRHRLGFHEARMSVLTFIKELTRRGFLVMTDGRAGGGG